MTACDRVCLVLPTCVWVCLGFPGFAWVCLRVPGFACVCLGLSVCVCVRLGLSTCVLGKKNYAKYVNYNWSDYRLRMKLCKTFKVRHLAYTDGTKTLRGLVDPKHWAKNEGKNCRRRLRATITFEKKDDGGGVVEESGSDQDMVWDSEEEEWVPAEK